MAIKYLFLTPEQNMIAGVLDIAGMAAGGNDTIDRALQEWVETYRDDIGEIETLVRAASSAFTRMYGQDLLDEESSPDLPMTRDDLLVSVKLIRDLLAELNEAKTKLKPNETVRDNPTTLKLDETLAAECLRFASGHKLAKKAARRS